MKRKGIRLLSLIIVNILAVQTIWASSKVEEDAISQQKAIILLKEDKGNEASLTVNEAERYRRPGTISGKYDFKLGHIGKEWTNSRVSLELRLMSDNDWDKESLPLKGGFKTTEKTSIDVYQGIEKIPSSFDVQNDGSLLIQAEIVNSKQPLTVESKNMLLQVDRTNPEGVYCFKITEKEEKELIGYSFKNAFNVYPLSSTLYFAIGENNYAQSTIGEGYKVIEMEAAPYWNKDGRAMLPIKYIFDGWMKNVVVSKGIIWFTLDERNVKLNVKNNTAVINGTNYQLSAVPEIKNGRVYLSAEDVAYFYGQKWQAEENQKENVIIIEKR